MIRIRICIIILLLNIVLGIVLFQELRYKHVDNSISNQEWNYIFAYISKKSIPDCYIIRTEYGFKCVDRDKKVYRIYTNK